MEDVTHLFKTYRECVRHLWNTYYRPLVEPSQDWDLRDEFDDVARGIFSSLVLRPLGVIETQLSPEYTAVPRPLADFHVAPIVEHGIPIKINRDLPASGYWDHPISNVKSNEVELRLLRFFDFNKLGFRDYCYYEVLIQNSAHPEIVGRVALIEVEYARVLFDKVAEES